ncbi:ComF family protein [Limisphaera sp. 4302-co]|uniref:ComF family protein n=1 Tax=Limisphaera sp. 4302-co TaxID=3400417 RepID=UPI003C1AF736
MDPDLAQAGWIRVAPDPFARSLISRRWRRWWEAWWGLLYPRVCQLCRSEPATPRWGWVGRRCRRLVQPLRPPWCERCGLPIPGEATVQFECANCRGRDLPFSTARAAVVAEGPVLEAIHRYKYQGALWFEPFLARLLVRAAADAVREGGWDAIVPVPLHPVREREREFNQAARLARHLARATGLPLETGWLRRVRPTKMQALLSRDERLRNVRRAFQLRAGAVVRGRRLVLVDDVFTTGATTGACAGVLRQAGAAEVCVWTVARGL